MSTTSTEKVGDDIPGMPSPGIRTLASFLIFAHFLAISMVIVGNYQPPSPLRERLRAANAVMNYAQILNMYTDYAFYLTYGDTVDVDHTFEADLKIADGSDTSRHVQVPEKGLWPLARRQRYLNLNRNVASMAEAGAQDVESFIPQAVAVHLMNEHGAEEADIRVRGLRMQPMDEVNSPDPALADPYSERHFNTVYAAKVWLDENGTPQLLKTGSASFTAPTAGPEPAPSSPNTKN